MKVLDLRCSNQHAFEGWFGSEEAFQDQLAAGQVECPFCGDAAVAKMLSAPRINLGARAPSVAAPLGADDPKQSPSAQSKQELVAVAPAEEGSMQELQVAWLNMARQVLAQTEDVGGRFAEEARRIHYGETKRRGIRGQASSEETQALLEEGISVMPLPLPHALKGTLQ
jgi:hypothetical protein